MKVKLVASRPGTPMKVQPGGLSYSEHLAHTKDEVLHGNVTDANGNPWRTRSWMEGEFNAFGIEFKRAVERWWNNQLFLLPPDGSEPGQEISDATYGDFISSPNVPAHVRCGLEIGLIPYGVLGSPHVIIEAVRLDQPTGNQFRSYMLRVTNEDVNVSYNTDSSGHQHTQVTVAHEIGHWLGSPVGLTAAARYLHHVDHETCKAQGHSTNDVCEYGRTVSKRMAMMGMGSLVTGYEAQAWLNRARRHTRVLFGWDPIHRLDFEHYAKVPVSERQKRLSGKG